MVTKLPYLRALAIVNVVLNHATAWGFTAMFWWPHQYQEVISPNFDQVYSASYFILRTFEQLVIFAVPAFIFISGFHMVLVFNRKTKESEGQILIRRVRKLVTPYLIWSLIILLIQAILVRNFNLLDIMRKIVIGEAAPGYYFIPLMLQLYLLTPLILRWARVNWVSLIGVTATLMVAISFARYAIILEVDPQVSKTLRLLTAGWFFPGGLFWFALGAVAGLHQQLFGKFALRSTLLWQVGSVLFLILGVIEWELLYWLSGGVWISPEFTFVDVLFSLTLIMAFIGHSNRLLLFHSQVKGLDGKTYGIYLAHTFVLVIIARGIYHIVPAFLGYQIVFVVFLTACGVILPVLLMGIVKRSPARRGYEILFG